MARIEKGTLLDNGRFELTEKIAMGAIGVVWKGFERATGRVVAVKFLRAALSDELQDKFQKEISILQKLDHPFIVQYMFAGEHDGEHYLVTEYKQGTLRQLLDHKKLSGFGFWEAFNLFSKIGEALDYAHEQNILHRDIKPENILVSSGSNGEPHPFVSDFGVAVLTSGATRHLSKQSNEVGTAAYMAPEIWREAVYSKRSDIYAFGIMLYETLEGHRPFSTEDDQAPTLMRMHLDDPIPDASKTYQKTNNNSDVVKALQKALHKDPKQRYSTCKEMMQAMKEAYDRGTAEVRIIRLTQQSIRVAIVVGILAALVSIIAAVTGGVVEGVVSAQTNPNSSDPVAAVITSTATDMPTATFTPTATHTPTHTPTQTETPTATVPGIPIGKVLQGANIRRGPGTNYAVVAGAGAGDELEVTGQYYGGEGLWYEVVIPGLTAGISTWISGTLLDISGDDGTATIPVVPQSIIALLPTLPPPTAVPSPTPVVIVIIPTTQAPVFIQPPQQESSGGSSNNNTTTRPTTAPVVPTAAPVVPTTAPVVPTIAPVVPSSTPLPPQGHNITVTGFTLTNNNNNAIMSITNGTVVRLSQLPAGVYIHANVSQSSGVSRVEFNFDGSLYSENSAPYTYPGQGGWRPSVGSHTISATVYNTTGTAGQPTTVSFRVE